MPEFGQDGRCRPTELRVEYERSPANLESTRPPRFSWRVDTDRRGARQTAYRLAVSRTRDAASGGRGTLWDSGRVESTAATNVEYDGVELNADETYYWSVKVWTDAGESEWADPSSFSTALEPADWRGDWIAHQPGEGDTNGWRSRWRRPDENAEEWVQLDLGEVRTLSEISLHPTDPISVVRTPDDIPVTMAWERRALEGFGFPNAYRVEIASDPEFEEAVTVADTTLSGTDETVTDSIYQDETFSVQTHECSGSSGRYVRITATDLHEIVPRNAPGSDDQNADRKTVRTSSWQCFALAALTVTGTDGDDLARGGTVTASSSVESDTWGREHLINGHTESTMASASPLLGTEFELAKPIRSARAHVAAVGYGELYVNGERIGDRKLDPAWTDYEKRVLYTTDDITDQLIEGENALGLWLGRGWFSKEGFHWVGDGSPRARVTLTVEFEDGTTRSLATNGNWRATQSPLIENDIYDGEYYDARRKRDGWSASGVDDSDWDGATVVDAPGGTLRPERIEPMGVVETFDVEAVHEHPKGPILDFGQNFTGWLELEIEDPDDGDEITLSHAEALTDDGELSTADLRTADATDTYVARGDDIETYEPRFTYHGFRYAQVSGYPGDLEPENVTAKAVTTAMDRRGEFACSSEELNRVQRNAVWGLRSNTHSVPEDCPQRDERFGWTGDAHVSTRSLLFNFDAVRFEEKWTRDHADVASEMGYVPDVVPNKAVEAPADPTWSITRVMVPWYCYLHDGDQRVLDEHYVGMRDYVDYWMGVAEDGIVPDAYGKYGDWLAPENTDGRHGLPYDLFNTAFVYRVTDIFAKIASVLGNEADAETYRDRAAFISDAFDREFFDPETGVYGPGTQSSSAVPLFFGMVPEEHIGRVAENLAEKVRADGGTLRSGFLGTRPLIHTLADHGYDELAYEVVSQPERPGWIHMVRNDATTMWERWNSDESVGSGMNSLNHSPFTHVSEFFYEVLAGITLENVPVTEHVTIAPSIVADLEWVSGSIETRAGELAVEWERDGDAYELTVTVPWNGRATIRLPEAADATVMESNTVLVEDTPDGVRSVENEGDDLVVEIGAGDYEFSVR